jgi:hypothetical protein
MHAAGVLEHDLVRRGVDVGAIHSGAVARQSRRRLRDVPRREVRVREEVASRGGARNEDGQQKYAASAERNDARANALQHDRIPLSYSAGGVSR